MYYNLEPEVAGHLSGESIRALSNGSHLVELHYVMDGWLGDDLIESFPCFILSNRVRVELDRANFSGYEFGDARVTTSELFQELHSEVELPAFSWLKVTGQPGIDDFGIAKDRRIVVSERALAVIREAGQLSDCLIEPYDEKEQG